MEEGRGSLGSLCVYLCWFTYENACVHLCMSVFVCAAQWAQRALFIDTASPSCQRCVYKEPKSILGVPGDRTLPVLCHSSRHPSLTVFCCLLFLLANRFPRMPRSVFKSPCSQCHSSESCQVENHTITCKSRLSEDTLQKVISRSEARLLPWCEDTEFIFRELIYQRFSISLTGSQSEQEQIFMLYSFVFLKTSLILMIRIKQKGTVRRRVHHSSRNPHI